VNALPIGKGIVYKSLDPSAEDIYEGIFENDLVRHFTQKPTLIKDINTFEDNV
jgi:hypothetical protein